MNKKRLLLTFLTLCVMPLTTFAQYQVVSGVPPIHLAFATVIGVLILFISVLIIRGACLSLFVKKVTGNSMVDPQVAADKFWGIRTRIIAWIVSVVLGGLSGWGIIILLSQVYI